MFSRSTLSSSIHIVNRFAAYFSYCSISSKNSLSAKQQTLLSFGAAKLQTIFNPATLFRFFFKKLSNLALPAELTAFSLNWDGKSTAFFYSCKGLIKLFSANFPNTFILNLFNIKKK
ncbi:hypothetical protein TBC1_11811 [Lentimicrobium saccharophilum]|uniref:Uncharacterized protein n=1 Tax=Lentimicrobium saccharophilum TaxID=1678841 RepID=A0A0S7BWA9_9BACT|nr:hypothetical protein [Lentimicrobium saccharophilum]GAP42679.1 hypothetical protein TBC1_11811 [Lentimicrobium saccharophilum]